jgi:small subunit ribosomal protein S4
LENQFRNIYKKANQRKGVTGDILLQMLESRLDSLLYKAGIGSSRAESRQIIRHNGIKVNDKNVNIPSFRATPGDKISLSDKLKKQLRITSSLANAAEKGFPDWLEVNSKEMSIVFKAYPARSDLPTSINEGAVVELYSK